MQAKDYPVTFGYGAKTTINGVPYTHRGEDRRMPTGTEIWVGDTKIGTSGNTGKSTGPHLHLQVGTDSASQQTINPSPYWFKPGTVTNLRTTNTGDWGKFVTIKTGDKYATYAHLDTVNVSVGQVIKEANMPVPTDLATARILSEKILGRDGGVVHAGGTDGDLKANHVGRPLDGAYIYQLWTSPEAAAASKLAGVKDEFYRTYKDQIAELSSRPTKAQLEALGQSLQESQAKVAEAEKALEEAKKQGGISAEDSAAIKENNSLLRKLIERINAIFK